MKSWLKVTGFVATTLCAGVASAADHGDGPAVGMTAGADITDVYTWMNNGKLVLIQNISGAAFSDSVQYAFHVSRTDMPLAAANSAPTAETLVICEFGATDGSDVTCYGGDSTTFEMVTGDATDSSNPLTSTNMTLTAGQYQDPFYFYLTGFNNARAEVGEYAAALSYDQFGCPDTTITHPDADGDSNTGGGTDLFPSGSTVSQVLLGILTGAFDDQGSATSPANDLAGNNVMSIIMEIDPALVAGTGDYFRVWASTHAKGN